MVNKKLDMSFVFGGIEYCLTFHKCPKCGDQVGSDHGFIEDDQVNIEKTNHEICEECGYEYDITYKITVEIKAKYNEPESCKRCDFKDPHEHVS